MPLIRNLDSIELPLPTLRQDEVGPRIQDQVDKDGLQFIHLLHPYRSRDPILVIDLQSSWRIWCRKIESDRGPEPNQFPLVLEGRQA